MVDIFVSTIFIPSQNDIPTQVLIKLARFYGTSIDYLLGETHSSRRYPQKK